MNLYKFYKVFILTAVFFTVSTFLHGQEIRTAGEVTLSFRTVTDNGNYAPKHVLAVWVEDENGFVKSRLVRANNRKQYLYTWIAASSYNETDAVTGATISSHQAHTVVWDCTDLEGTEVPDGIYTIHVEFTERHAQGPLYSIEFEKGTEEQHTTPFDVSNFKDIQLDFYPEITGVELQKIENELSVFPNPGNGLFTIDRLPAEVEQINIVNNTGKTIQTWYQDKIMNTGSLLVDLSHEKNGIYLLRIHIKGQSISRKLIKN